jgi:hypothetical protein
MRRLRALAPGDDARARQARHDLVRACWGKEGFQAIMALNDKTLRAGWDKLKGLAPAQPSAADEAPAARLAEDAPQAAQAAAPTAADLEALSQRYAAVGFAESYHARRAEVALVTPALYQEWVDVVEGLERMQAKAGPQTGEG